MSEVNGGGLSELLGLPQVTRCSLSLADGMSCNGMAIAEMTSVEIRVDEVTLDEIALPK